MSAHAHARLTVEEYLQLDGSLQTRNEYYAGRMYAMSGGTFDHGVIIGNFSAQIWIALANRPCRVIPNDLRVRVAADGLYTYPDIVVACGDPIFAPAESVTLTNPILLAEVLSPSTEAYDRGFKSVQYRQLPSLKEYVIVSQDEPRVEVMQRIESGQWRLSEYAGLDAVCHLNSIDCDISLASVYQKVNFSKAAGDSDHPSAAE